MAKKAILDVLESTIGKYVRNLDAESLNVAVWSGNIQLHSLELNVDAVNGELDRQAAEAPNLALPFRVIDGEFTNFEVVVPWSRITSRPVILRARGLKVSVEPCDRLSENKASLLVDHSNAEKEAKKVEEERLQSIQRANESRLRANALRNLADIEIEDDDTIESSAKGTSSFGARLVRRIVENLQVEVNDVHVSLKGTGFSAGVVLESLSLATTDKDGNRTFVDRTKKVGNDVDKSFLYKALQIKGLGVYLDDESPKRAFTVPFSVPEGDQSLVGGPLQHSYILSPLSFEAKLRQSDEIECIDFPKYLLSSELSKLSILLTRNQLELGNKIATAIRPSHNVVLPLFPEYRPLHRVNSSNAKEWWRYAFRCIGRLNGRRSWVEFFEAFQKRKKYIPLYKRDAHHESCPWLKPLSPEEKDLLETTELDRSFSREGIMSWRNIADAQVERERRKHEAAQAENKKKKSYLSSFFGTSSDAQSLEEEEEPPISLTVEEMKELEAISLEQAAEMEVSKNSKLYDVKFILGAFKIDLITHGMRPVAALDMGTVTTTFDANADGSFAFDLKLSSLEVHDKATLNSLFPTVVRSLRSGPSTSSAFNIRLEKSKTGDQQLVLNMVAFQMVASSVLLTEVKRFFSLSTVTTPSGSHYYRQNPMLEQSLSGTVDLFYDAGEGSMIAGPVDIVDETAAAAAKATAAVSDQLSSALADAWKSKNKTQTSWTVDCDIHAPIVILPQNCVDVTADVLVFDLGHFNLKYGKIDPPKNVSEWFEEQPRLDSTRPVPLLDYGVLAVSNLMFATGKTGKLNWETSNVKSNLMENEQFPAVIEPVSLGLDFGVESPADEVIPRVCMFGILPGVSFGISPAQVSSVVSVLAAWKAVLDAMKGTKDQEAAGEGLTILEEVEEEIPATASRDDESISLTENLRGRSSMVLALAHDGVVGEKETRDFPMFFFSIALRRLSVRAITGDGGGIEAHLVSVSSSADYRLDGSASCHLRMGWFWVLDRLSSEFPRQQRLLVHSNLPHPAASFAENDEYNIMDVLQSLGAFEDSFSGSSELADITWKLSGKNTKNLDVLTDSYASQLETDSDEFSLSVLDAKFTSLFVHWNPHAIKAVTSVQSKFISPQKRASIAAISSGNSTTGSPIHFKGSPRLSVFESPLNASRRESITQSFEIDDASASSKKAVAFVMNAQMSHLEISLNSAIDDLPIFEMTMSGTKVNLVSSKKNEESDMNASLVLGDVRIEAPTNGRTRQSYRTLLGLAPNESSSLLTVQYSMGKTAIQSLSLQDVDVNTCDACAKVELSPMKLIYIQAQVLTLVEYVTEGILGTIFAKAASSAKEVAMEIASTGAGGKIFVVNAVGFDLIVPQAAYSPKHLTLRAGDLDVRYHAPGPVSVSKASLSLSEVSLEDNAGRQLVETPIRMAISVGLPPIDLGGVEDQAMRVAITISNVSFQFTKVQYKQMMDTLSFNVSELDSFLRGDNDVGRFDGSKQPSSQIQAHSNRNLSRDEVLPETAKDDFTLGITHAGVMAVDKPRRMYIEFLVEVLSLELCGEDVGDRIVKMAAIETCISLKLIPDEEKTVIDVRLLNLVCEDRRRKALNREFQSLVSQADGAGNEVGKDVFQLSYVKYQNQSSQVDLRVGSPRFVFIPDAVAEILDFISLEVKATDPGPGVPRGNKLDYDKEVEVHFDKHDESVEASFVPSAADTSTMSISITTASCSVVLIDMGYDNESPRRKSMILATEGSSGQVLEAIVLQGSWNAKMTRRTAIASGRPVSLDLEMHGEEMQIYSAHGKKLESPLQILEPVQLTVVMASKTRESNATEVDVKMVTLTSIDMVFSMQNAALLNAISSSFSQAFSSDVVDEKAARLTEAEASRIERLASALEKDDGIEVSSDTGVLSREVSTVEESPNAATVTRTSTDTLSVNLRMTMPETKITFINDLQGLDQALFRTTARNFVAGLQFKNGFVPQAGSAKQVTFNCQVNSSLLADYFDTSINLWEELLAKPWEVTFNSARGVSKRFQSHRMSTTVDVESCPCHVSFSEQFLVSIGAANRMWSVYSLASGGDPGVTEPTVSVSEQRSVAASAARSLITTLPYAIENHSGVDAHLSLNGEGVVDRPCPSGTIQYFRFEPPQGTGCGGLRLYGQDVSRLKGLSLLISDRRIEIDNIDAQVNLPRQAHSLGHGRFVISQVLKQGKTTVLHLSSQVDVQNCSSLQFQLAVARGDQRREIGICKATNAEHWPGSRRRRSSILMTDGSVSEPSRNYGIPVDSLDNFDTRQLREGASRLSLLVFPCLVNDNPRVELCGTVDIYPLLDSLRSSGDGASKTFEVTCKSQASLEESELKDRLLTRVPDPFVVRICARIRMVDKSHPFVEISIEPRAILENKMPISIFCRTPMPHTFSKSLLRQAGLEQDNAQEVTHNLSPNESVEIYTPGPSIAVSFKCADPPVGGGATDWMEGGWVDLPLVPEFRFLEPLGCNFPFVRGNTADPLGRSRTGGIEFFIAESDENLSEALLERGARDNQGGATSPAERNELLAFEQELAYSESGLVSKFVVTICNYAVDHTGDVLFEKFGGESKLRRSSTSVETVGRSSFHQSSTPFSAFSSPNHLRRISPLPDSTVNLQLLHLTMEGEDGMKRSLPFRVEDVSICEGGIGSTSIRWQDESPSGFFAYRRLVSSYQSEVHVIPEFIIFNGSKKDRVLVRQYQGIQMIIDPGKMAPIRKIPGVGLILSMDFIDLGVRTVPFPCDTLGLKMCVVKAADGSPCGSLAVQTVIGARDSRLAVKLGQIKYGDSSRSQAASSSTGLFSDDFLRVRIRWSELQLTLNEARPTDPDENKALVEAALDQMYKEMKPSPSDSPFGITRQTSQGGSTETWIEARKRHHKDSDSQLDTHQAVAVIILHRFTVDFQKIFKDDFTASKQQLVQSALLSPERSQLSVIIHNVMIKDCTPGATYPVVFDCRSASSFFDLCVRCRGPLDADLVRIDMVDLNLAYSNGHSERIVVETSEEFVWKLIDVINRILVATAELAGVDLRLEWDEQQGGYVVSAADTSPDVITPENIDDTGTYTPPESDKLYDVHSVKVSPFKMLLSFKRQPQSSRYKHIKGVRFAKLMNYFTKRLKFKIDKAELNFGRYEASNVKGPPDRLFELLKAYYVGKIKLKMVTLMTAVSIQDWKYLASREGGDENWKEGDYVRLTGNLAGSGASYVLKKVGAGLGDGLSAITGTLGQGIEDATDMVGARAVGAGVNSVVTGVGDGVGSTIKGVGAGAGKVFRGAGKGVGHVFGGVTGGAQQVAKGIGKGVSTGDGRAVLTGIGEGASSLGTGVGQGVESVVTGAADGVLLVGSGVVSGFKSIGQGIGGVFGGKKPQKPRKHSYSPR